MVQKRKVKEPASFSEWNFNKGKRSNASYLNEIFKNKKKGEKSEVSNSEEEEEEGNQFLSRIFNRK